MDHLAALRVLPNGLLAHLVQLVNGLVEDLREELLGTETLVANLLYPLVVFRQFPLYFGEVGLYLFDEFVEEHLHDGEVVFELVHDFVADVIVAEELVLVLSEGLAVDYALLEADVALVGDHALPLGEHQDEDLGLVERDAELLHREAVVDLEREVVEEDGLVALEEEPVLDPADGLLLALGLLVLLRYGLVDVLLLGLVGIARVHHRNLLLLRTRARQLDLLDHLLVLEVDLVHTGRHVQLVLRTLLRQIHRTVYVVSLPLLLRKHLQPENLLP